MKNYNNKLGCTRNMHQTVYVSKYLYTSGTLNLFRLSCKQRGFRIIIKQHILLQSRSNWCCNYVLVSYHTQVTAYSYRYSKQSPAKRGFAQGTSIHPQFLKLPCVDYGLYPTPTRTRTSPNLLLRLFVVSQFSP